MSKIKRARHELWVPPYLQRKPAQPPTGKRFFAGFPCPECCGGCTCAECADDSTAPCCWQVVIAGIVNGSCTDCADLNKTYFLSQDIPEGCTWSEGAVCGDCDPTDIILVVSLSGSDYLITVTMGDHVWQKNYGTSKPDCTTLSSETITHVTNSGDCDSSSATCAITALAGNPACQTASCFQTCSVCDDFPEEWAVDFGVGGWVNSNCDFCDQIAGVFVVGNTFSGSPCDSRTDPNAVACNVPANVTFQIIVGMQLLAGSMVENRAQVRIGGGGGSPLVQHRYDGTAFAEGLSCLATADGDGKITLTKATTVDSIPGTTCVALSTNPLPNTIQIWDANA